MLRISYGDVNRGTLTLRLEGEITGPWVDETDRVCEAVLAKGKRLRIDLSQVAFVDRAGITLLANLEQQNAMLVNCSLLLKMQLQRMR